MPNAGLFVGGFKGASFLEKIHARCDISFVSSYENPNISDDSARRVQALCASAVYAYFDRKQLAANGALAKTDVFFAAGWQFLLQGLDDRLIVFHDSVLPRYRGFAPTVTALINGDRTIGVSAIRPTALADRGPILGQRSIEISYPIKIRAAYEKLAECYAALCLDLLAKMDGRGIGSLPAAPQDESRASYSIWRDADDYRIDWQWPAVKIARFVDAVGWPYQGARCRYKGAEIIVEDVVQVPDLRFEARQPGKIWLLESGQPVVVCGDGMLKIVNARRPTGEPVVFDKLRERLG